MKAEREYVLWGRKEGDPIWAEDFLMASKSQDDIEHARKVATYHGYSIFRTSYFDGVSLPDFAGAVVKKVNG